MTRTLPYVDSGRTEEARSVPVVQTATRPMIRRGTDRTITFGGVLLGAALLGTAWLTAIERGPGGSFWLPIHLAMAGSAGVAIGAVLPFFTTALAQAVPARPAVRIASIGLLATGAVLAAAGMRGAGPTVAAAGGAAYLVGLVGTAFVAFGTLRSAPGFRPRLVHVAYATALVEVGVGVALATTMLAGWSPVAGAWAALKPAHAWLNVFGFVVLVVAASLLHLAPTVGGARIQTRRSATAAIGALMAGPPLVAAGYGFGLDALGRIGAVVAFIGTVALLAHGLAVHRAGGGWTSDLAWHRFARLSLLMVPAWLVVAVGVAGGRILWFGTVPAAWSVDLVVFPLVVGGIGQALVGSWTHIVPAIGPGDQATHARQRRWLGRIGLPRWIAWNVGVGFATAGSIAGLDVLRAVGGLLLIGVLGVGLGLLVQAVSISPRLARVAAA